MKSKSKHKQDDNSSGGSKNTYSPGSDDKVNKPNFLAVEKRTLLVHFLGELLEMLQELLPQLIDLLLIALTLQEPMVSRDDPAGAVIGPDPGAGLLVWIGREEVRFVVWVGFFEEFAYYGGFVEGFVIVA